MKGDLKGQMTLFPEPGRDAAREAAAALDRDLPEKSRLTKAEAARALGCTPRHIEHLIADGTLLAVDISRDASVMRTMRVAGRMDRPFDPERTKFLTLAEFQTARSNVRG
jgi:hypothetical protein